MRILHLTETFSALSETFIYDSVVEIAKKEDVHMAAITFQNERDRPFKNKHLIAAQSYWLPARAALKLTHRLSPHPSARKDQHNWPFYRLNISELLRRLKPDLVHCHFGPMGVLASPVCRLYKIPFGVSFYGYDISQLMRSDYWQREYEGLFRQGAFFNFLSEDMKRRGLIFKCPEHKAHVIHLSRRLSGLKPESSKTPIRKILSIGRLVEKKGFVELLAAFRRLAPDHPEIELEIIGDGPDKEGLERLLAGSDIRSRVHFLGALNNRQTLKRLKTADLFVLASKTSQTGDQEGTPTVLIESQALGKLSVSTKHAGIPEMFPHENQDLLANEADIGSLVEKIKMALSFDQTELDRRIGISRQHIENNFNLEIESQKQIDIYHEL